MNKKVILGIAISIVLIYFSFRDVNFRDALEHIKKINLVYAALSLFFIVLMQALRSYRWGVILSPLEKINQFTLFSVTCVGFLAISVIPARLGELARPFLISRKSSVKMSSGLGTVAMERVLDFLSILIITILMLFVFWQKLPVEMIISAVLFFIITLIMIFFTVSLVWRREKALLVIQWFVRKLPGQIFDKIDPLIHHFIDGFGVIKNVKMLLHLFFLSAVVWLVDVAAIYSLFLAFGFNLPVLAAFVVMVILIAGIAIPTAPGFIGNWHVACILGLSLFGVAKLESASFALVYHFLSMMIVVILGVVFLPFNKFSISDMKEQMNKTEDSKTGECR
jgi:glycosyltransferase 2 family protein